MLQFNPLVPSHPSLVQLIQGISVLHSDEPVSMETNPQEPVCSIHHTLSIAQHLSGASCLLKTPRAHYPNSDWRQNDTVFWAVCSQFFLVWMRSPARKRASTFQSQFRSWFSGITTLHASLLNDGKPSWYNLSNENFSRKLNRYEKCKLCGVAQFPVYVHGFYFSKGTHLWIELFRGVKIGWNVSLHCMWRSS